MDMAEGARSGKGREREERTESICLDPHLGTAVGSNTAARSVYDLGFPG